MEISIAELVGYLSAVAAPATAYTGWVHREIAKTHKRIDLRVKQAEYDKDREDLKDMLREVRGDIKELLRSTPK